MNLKEGRAQTFCLYQYVYTILICRYVHAFICSLLTHINIHMCLYKTFTYTYMCLCKIYLHMCICIYIHVYIHLYTYIKNDVLSPTLA